MATQKTGFVDQHIEKVVVGLCGFVLLGSVWYSFMGNRFAVDDLGPEELCRQIGTQADQTAQAVRNARLKEINESSKNPEADPVGEWFGPQSIGLNKIARIDNPFWRTQPFPPPFLPVTLTPEEDRRDLTKLAQPGIPVLTMGHTGFDLPETKPDLLNLRWRLRHETPCRPRSRNWVLRRRAGGSD